MLGYWLFPEWPFPVAIPNYNQTITRLFPDYSLLFADCSRTILRPFLDCSQTVLTFSLTAFERSEIGSALVVWSRKCDLSILGLTCVGVFTLYNVFCYGRNCIQPYWLQGWVSDSQEKCVLDGNASVVHLSPVIWPAGCDSTSITRHQSPADSIWM